MASSESHLTWPVAHGQWVTPAQPPRGLGGGVNTHPKQAGLSLTSPLLLSRSHVRPTLVRPPATGQLPWELWPADVGRELGGTGTLSSLSPQNGRSVSKRGVSCQFGPDVTKAFLEENQLDYIIRSHEVKAEGYEVAHGGRCVTVFSAPNYWCVPIAFAQPGLSPQPNGFYFL